MNKIIHCGECEKFAYEDTDGYGFCLKANMECRCSDKCHITHGKDIMYYDSILKTSNTMKEKKWRIELTEHQLMLLAKCVEDCHRFVGGQMELSNSTSSLTHYMELSEELGKLQPLVTPQLECGASYGWNGGACPNDNQRKFLAETYYLYREIYHQVTLDDAKHRYMDWNVYLGETLTCNESGEPIKVERIE